MFDCHTHSTFSSDSVMEAGLACEKAISLGIEGIVFADHLDYDYPDHSDEFLIDFDVYSSYIDSLKSKYKNKLKVFKGVEVGIQPHVMDDTDALIDSFDFDVVIGSVHIVDKTDLHNGDFCKDKSKHQAYLRYLEEVSNMVSNFNNFDILGHLDLIRRYGKFVDKTLNYFDYKDVIDKILKKLIQKQKGLEINTSGYRYHLGSPMPGNDIVKRYKDLGGEIICMSSDAHRIEHIAYEFESVKQMLLNVGFRYVVHFEQRRPVYTKIV